MKRFLEKRRDHLEDESGSVIILVAGMLVVMLVAAAFALDFGRVYIVNSKVQTACDVSAMAAVAKYDPTKTGCDKTNNLKDVRDEAKRVMKVNGYEINDCDVIINEVDQTVEVKKKVSVDTTFAKIININKLNTSKSAVAAKKDKKKPFSPNYALFSGSTTNDLIAGGTLKVDGDTHVNGKLNIWGSVTGNGKFEYGGVNNLSGALSSQEENGAASTVAMPDYDKSIMDKIPTDDKFTMVYDNLEQYCKRVYGKQSVDETVQAYGKVLITGNVKIIDIGSVGVPLEINGNVITERRCYFSNKFELSKGSFQVRSRDGVSFNSGNIKINGYIVTEGRTEFPMGFSDLPAADKQSVIYCKSNNGIYFGNGATTISALLYAPNGEIQFAGGSYQIYGAVIADTIGSNYGAIDIHPTLKDWDMEMEEDDASGGNSNSGKSKLVK